MLVKAALILAGSSFAFAQTNPCGSFGVDFQDGGSYFQNSLSNTPFTFVESFEGCSNDTAQNILVDPLGNQYQCTDTPMLPANTSELSTCPLNKTQLTTGEWSVIILSNNGDADPIAYQRDFSITVGPQATATVTPTITVNVTSTPIQNVTLWVTETNYTTLPPQTYTTPSVTVTPTKTLTPKPITTTVVKTVYTVHYTVPWLSLTTVMKTATATCTVPFRQPTCDGFAKIKPTVSRAVALASSASITITPAPKPTIVPKSVGKTTVAGRPINQISNVVPNPPSNFRPNVPSNVGAAPPSSSQASAWGGFSGSSSWGSSSFSNRFGGWKKEKARRELNDFLDRRHENLEKRNLHKRAPDVPTLTVTDSNTADWKTTTQTWVIATQTLTATSTTWTTATVTPSPVPVITGQSTAAVHTSTVAASTKTVVQNTIAWSVTTKMQVYTMTLTTTVTPTASLSVCKLNGGWFWPHGW